MVGTCPRRKSPLAAKFTESPSIDDRVTEFRVGSGVAVRVTDRSVTRRDFLHQSRDGLAGSIVGRIASGVSSFTKAAIALGAIGGSTRTVLAQAPGRSNEPGTAGGKTNAISTTVPTPAARFERGFDVHYGEYDEALRVASLAYRFEQADGRYRASSDGEAVGIVALVYSGKLRQSSEGQFDSNGLTPRRYREKRGKRAERTIDFDPVARTMSTSASERPLPFPPLTQDRLSVFFHLAWRVRRDPAGVRPGKSFLLPLASTKHVDMVTVTSMGEKPLRIGGESVPTLQLKLRNEARQDDPRIDVWLSADADRMPVRIRFEESDGTVVDQIQRRNR